MPPTPLSNLRVLFFDVFGTVCTWRLPVASALHAACLSRISAPTASAQIPASTLAKARTLTLSNWQDFTASWRASYLHFTSTYSASHNTSEFIDIDTHHLQSLTRLLDTTGLASLFPQAELETLSKLWHHLPPHPDAAAGLAKLNALGLKTVTLSNGNVALLRDLVREGDLPFQEIVSAEMFGAYKPDSAVYRGAMERLGVKAGKGEAGMVAAHLGDLKAARACGMRTVYVVREGEEGWGEEEVKRAKSEGWVDVWVGVGQGEGQGGFVEVARRVQGMRGDGERG